MSNHTFINYNSNVGNQGADSKLPVLIRFPQEQYDEEDAAFVYFSATETEFVAELTQHTIKLSPRYCIKSLCVPAGASIVSLLSRLNDMYNFSASKMVKDDFWKSNKLPAPADPALSSLLFGCGPWTAVHEGPLIM